MEDQHELDLYRSVLDAMPLMVFVVDDDITVLQMNAMARETLKKDISVTQGMRGGEILNCIHSTDHPGGCGRGPECKKCHIRNSVFRSYSGETITRRRTKATFRDAGTERNAELYITSTPFTVGTRRLVLLTIEDITELSTLRNIIPICMHCKKVRNDEEYWQEVELYFRSQVGVDFSHGICPKCIEERYSNLISKKDLTS